MATDANTVYQDSPPTALLIAVPQPLDEVCLKAASIAGALRVESCKAGDAPTVASTARPFAIIIAEAVYEFDPDEFEALARDVGGTLIRLPERNMSEEQWVDWLVPPLEAAYRRSLMAK